jgi:hypothetical protein
MDICIVGWYLYDDLYKILKEVNKKYHVTIISHKGNEIKTEDKDDSSLNVDSIASEAKEFLKSCELDYCIVDNIGLEFGAYDYFLKNCWNKESNVLFMHDDVKITDINVFDRIALLGDKNIDQSYIFKNKAEEINNGGKHGRAIFMSAKLLNFMLNYSFTTEESVDHEDNHNKGTILKGTGEYTGFWYDPNNYGHTTGKPSVGVRHYNEMIYTFHRTMGRVRDRRYGNEKMSVVNRDYYPELDCARRGIFREEKLKK